MPDYESERLRQEYMARIRGLRPIDDDFMRCLFRDNIPLAQMVLRIVTGIEDLVVTELSVQKDLKRLGDSRSICLDAYAKDSSGKIFDLEIQRADVGADVRRARYHSSAMDIENLKAGQDFSELPETYTIFITENDFFRKGRAVYRFERMDAEDKTPFNDGEHILYVNGAFRDNSDIGRLMHDFSCWNPEDMNYDLLRDKARYFKEDAKGVSDMCRVFEEVKNEGIRIGEIRGKEIGEAIGREIGKELGKQEEKLNSIKAIMTSFNLSATQAMEALNVPVDQRDEYAKKLNS